MSNSHLNDIAKRKVNRDGWEPFAWEVVEGGLLVTGSILKIGPRGGKTWVQPATKVIVTHEELDAARAEYEATTGNCAECMGKGERVVGWNHETGKRYGKCKGCGGTGTACR